MVEIHYPKAIAISFSMISIVLMQFNTQLLLADEFNPGLYSSNSNPYGTSLPEWTTKWWQWYIGIPNTGHPFADRTGVDCGVNQGGPVWYLTGAAGKVVRTCEIPSDKAILFPILNTECSHSESPDLKTEEDLRKCAIDSNKGAVLGATLDNHTIKNIDNYRITSSPFNVTYPSDPVYPIGSESNVSLAVSDGWFIMLEPLKPGPHVLMFNASQEVPPTAIDVTYKLMIK